MVTYFSHAYACCLQNPYEYLLYECIEELNRLWKYIPLLKMRLLKLKKKIITICSCDRLLLFTDIYYPVPFSLKGNFLTLGMLILPMAFFGQ